MAAVCGLVFGTFTGLLILVGWMILWTSCLLYIELSVLQYFGRRNLIDSRSCAIPELI